MSKQIEKKTQTGTLDARNTLNDLTGREWVYFLNSIELIEGEPYLLTGDKLNDLSEEQWTADQSPLIDTFYPTSGENSHAHHIRKKHPSPKPPQLMKRLIEFFTKINGWVLDPFVGVGGTLLGCSMAGRHGVGVDLSQEYLDLYEKAAENLNLEPQTVYQGDSRRLDNIFNRENYQFDLVLTDPPYGDMLSRKRTGERKKRTGDDSPTPFTSDEDDLGNMGADQFYEALKSVIAQSMEFLKVKGYVVVFCKDLQPTAEHHNLIHADVVNALTGIPNLRFRGYKIWYDKSLKLYPFGYPYAYVSNQLHQFILIFRKES
ncbi:MAG: DNA methyltransferase [Candidatus Poribacteria bacterium]|nr:DNA methyltransferase [Candidatus Poribacteria bacterium]MDE0506619.1 DNA methyltransferase [Candidatus Poribacteria bacterium]